MLHHHHLEVEVSSQCLIDHPTSNPFINREQELSFCEDVKLEQELCIVEHVDIHSDSYHHFKLRRQASLTTASDGSFTTSMNLERTSPRP
jgi:hypothetical protein